MRFGVRPERHFYIFHIEQHRPVDVIVAYCVPHSSTLLC